LSQSKSFAGSGDGIKLRAVCEPATFRAERQGRFDF